MLGGFVGMGGGTFQNNFSRGSVTGDIGVSPIAASAITGFGLILPAAGAFSTSALVTGKVYASDYANPTSANLTAAVLDMQNAYIDAMGRSLGAITELGAGNIGGLTLAPGLYKWSTGLTIPTDVTLSGSANDVWIFQVSQSLNVSSSAKVILSGGAQSGNVFWVVGGQTTIGTNAIFNGNILDQTAVVLNTGAILNGRALAQTAITLDANNILVPVLMQTPTPTPILNPTPVPVTASISTSASVIVPINTSANVNAASNVNVPNQQLIDQAKQQLISLMQQVIQLLEAKVSAIIANTPQFPNTGFASI